jgi:hypothetical protein
VIFVFGVDDLTHIAAVLPKNHSHDTFDVASVLQGEIGLIRIYGRKDGRRQMRRFDKKQRHVQAILLAGTYPSF